MTIAALDLLKYAAESDWNTAIQHGYDTNLAPFVTVEGKARNAHFRVTWHTRDTGTYRMFHCVGSRHVGAAQEMTLRAVKALIDEVDIP